MQPVAITNADGHTWTYTYNLDGNITHQTDYNGIVTTNTTSPDGLVSAVTTPAGTTTTTRNQLGLTTSIDDASGTTLFDYDPFGRLTSITNPAATITYTRDTYGRAISETTRLASGEETRHALELSPTGMVTREHLGLPVAGTITTGYGRNAAGEITSSTITQHTTPTDDSALHLPTGDADTGRLLAELTYTTNTRGHRATTAIDNLVRTINIDTRGRITGDHTSLLDSTTTGGLAPVAGRDFTWRADSTLTAITDQLRGTTSFTVDAIGRATSATRTPQPTNTSSQGTTPPHTPARAGTPAQSSSATSGGSAQENYSFTPAGVLASTADGVIDYHNTLPVKVGRTTYTYDAAGRITRTVTKRLSKKPLVHHFYYATGEQPIGFTSSDEPAVGYRYTYDGLGRRVAKETINTTTGEVIHRDVFTHTGNQLAAVITTVDATDPAGVGEGYVWTTDPATGETHGQIALTNGTSDATQTPANPAAGWSQARIDATFYALVCDLAGAPQELINTTTGAIEGHTTQTLYGKRTWAGRCSSPLLFAGQYEDAESGWAYNRFRYYNPTLGAYNAQDPLGLAPRLASAQGYVDHAAYWVDMFGLEGCGASGKYPDSVKTDRNGRYPRNGHLANSRKTFEPGTEAASIAPDGVPFGPDGHPIFDEFVHNPKHPDGSPIMIDGKPSSGDIFIDPDYMTKRSSTQFAQLDRQAGISESYRQENSLTWHHHQQPRRFQLVPKALHSKTGHTGGNSYWGFGSL